jgi:hypothetical protein
VLFPLVDPLDVVRWVLSRPLQDPDENELLGRVLDALSTRPQKPPGVFPESAMRPPDWLKELVRLPGWDWCAGSAAQLELIREVCRLGPDGDAKLRTAADRIRDRVKKTVQDIIEIGNDLLAAKDTLPHGQCIPWVRAEFGWSERSAQNFMSVAEKFKSAKIADLPIQPSAAYLLAAPSVPDEAREKAVEKAEAGEEITFAAAREIVAEARKKKRPRRLKTMPPNKLAGRLVMVLKRYRDRWDPKELAELARQLQVRRFAQRAERWQEDEEGVIPQVVCYPGPGWWPAVDDEFHTGNLILSVLAS